MRPDYVVQVSEVVFAEVAGPMLKRGIQGVHGWRLQLPSRASENPDRDLLAAKFSLFSR